MAVTLLADVIVPEIFNQYVQRRTSELSRIRNSGIMANVPGLAVPQGGTTVKMPFWNDIDGDDEVWSSGHETVPDNITADKDIAAILTRIKSWGAEDLAGMFAGSDPMVAIGNLVASYWARKEQKILLSILKGVFDSDSMDDNRLDASDDALSNELFIDALSMLGDASESLTGMICHSAVRADLAKKHLLTEKTGEPVSADAPEFTRYLGRNIIVDDGVPKESVNDNRVYTTYFFGAGSFGYAEGSPRVPVEFEREAKKSLDNLITRREFIMHPMGVKWTGSAAKTTPSNSELATGRNWQRVVDYKQVRIIAVRHRVGGSTNYDEKGWRAT